MFLHPQRSCVRKIFFVNPNNFTYFNHYYIFGIKTVRLETQQDLQQLGFVCKHQCESSKWKRDTTRENKQQREEQ